MAYIVNVSVLNQCCSSCESSRFTVTGRANSLSDSEQSYLLLLFDLLCMCIVTYCNVSGGKLNSILRLYAGQLNLFLLFIILCRFSILLLMAAVILVTQIRSEKPRMSYTCMSLNYKSVQ